MHAEFLTQAPTPPTPGVTCVIDTGVNGNPDNDAAVIGRQTVYPGDGTDGDSDAHHGTYLAMNIAAPTNNWGMIGIAPKPASSASAPSTTAPTTSSQAHTSKGSTDAGRPRRQLGSTSKRPFWR
jgi:hypothetical protein